MKKKVHCKQVIIVVVVFNKEVILGLRVYWMRNTDLVTGQSSLRKRKAAKKTSMKYIQDQNGSYERGLNGRLRYPNDASYSLRTF
jgi:hypothetical protein